VKAACEGKATCTFQATNDFFGGDPCLNTVKHLSMKITCSMASLNPTFGLKVTLPPGQHNTRVNIPIVPNLKQTPQNLQIKEGATVIWSNSKYTPGVAGVVGASLNPSSTGVVVTVNSGTYQFSATAWN